MCHKHFLMIRIDDGLLFLVLVKDAQAWQSQDAELHRDQRVS